LKLCIFAAGFGLPSHGHGFPASFFSMDKQVFDFQYPGFSAGSAGQCTLNIVMGTEGFSLLAVARNGEIRALKSWQFANPGRDFQDAESNLRHVFGSEPVFSYPFERVRCAFFNLNATLVPRRLFDADDLAAYFKILLRPAEYEYRYDELPEFDCFLVYAIEPLVARMCGQYFPEAQLSHLAVPLLKNLRGVARRDDCEVFVNIRNQAAQVFVFDRQNLVFYNAFQYSKPSDLLYFVLLAYEQFRLNTSEITLTLCGNLVEDSDTFRLLYRYIQQVRFLTLPEKFVLPESADTLPAHYWYDLFCLQPSPVAHPQFQP